MGGAGGGAAGGDPIECREGGGAAGGDPTESRGGRLQGLLLSARGLFTGLIICLATRSGPVKADSCPNLAGVLWRLVGSADSLMTDPDRVSIVATSPLPCRSPHNAEI